MVLHAVETRTDIHRGQEYGTNSNASLTACFNGLYPRVLHRVSRWPVNALTGFVRSSLASPLVKTSLEQEAAIAILQGEVPIADRAGVYLLE